MVYFVLVMIAMIHTPLVLVVVLIVTSPVSDSACTEQKHRSDQRAYHSDSNMYFHFFGLHFL
jgi:hypothetical protein